VKVGRHYPLLCHDAPACEGAGETVGDLPVARRLAERELSLPIHPYVDDAAVERVVAACEELAR
jgi:dTDP-4-amino-4,6-dideoxygalactose transaminase